MEPPSPESAVGPQTLEAGTFCRQCGYDVSGLPTIASCPECGAAISNVTGDHLRDANPNWLAGLSRGLLIVIAATLAQIGVIFLLTGLTIFGFLQYEALAELLITGFTFASITGWWLFSTPDPGYTGRNDGIRARRLLRIALVIEAALTLANLVIEMLPPFTPGPNAPPISVWILIAVTTLISTAAWVVRFLATLFYVRWLAARAGDIALGHRARRYTWLLPLIFVIGLPCLGLGPLIAMIMYLLFIIRVRRVIDAIRDTQDASPEPALPT